MIERLIRYLLRRYAPLVGWPAALLAVGAACGPGLAAYGARAALPGGLLLWAGGAGALLGLRAGRAGRLAARLLWLSVALALGAALVVAGEGALPPAGLVWQDLVAAARSAEGWWHAAPAPAPEWLSWRYLERSLPRLGGALVAAPGAGEAGGELLLRVAAICATWAGALALGWAVRAGRPALTGGLPLIVALGLTTVLGGGSGLGLIMGLGLLLLLAVVAGHRARELAWERAGAAYSEELRWEVLGWGVAAIGAALALALAVPTGVPEWLARALWPAVELPSGIAALEENVERGGRRPAAEAGLSELPAVGLGVSLERGPPESLSLRVRVGGELPPGPWPRYWRARLLDRYDGRSWRADALVGPFGSPLLADVTPPGTVWQEVEELRPGARLIVALPELVALDGAAQAERLADGSLAAVAGTAGPRRYRALSLPQGAAAPERSPEGPPPDHSASLALPPGLPARVADLAQTVAGAAPGARAKALALEAYLRGLPYSYEVRPLPRGGDAVDQFLFEMRHGYCTYYASAMVVMARSLDIPARMAVGYATGSYDPSSGAYLVREADAHAWPELFIDGAWLPFEPTPIRPLPAREGPAAPAQPAAPAEPAGPDTEAPPALPWAALWLGGLATLAASGAAWLIWRRSDTPLRRAQLRLERLGARAGVAWPAGATLHEYARLLEARRGGESAALRELVALIEAARYGRRPLGAEWERRARAASAQIARWLRRR